MSTRPRLPPPFDRPQRVRVPEEQGPVHLDVHFLGFDRQTGAPQAIPPVVLCHGFPEMAYSWRHQMGPLASAGLRVLAPDQRGYAGSDAPVEPTRYDMDHLCGDLIAVLDHFEIDRAIFVGHDWGGFVVWSMPLLHPDRVAGVVGLNTPLIQPLPIPPLALFRQLRGESNYIVAFQEEGRAEEILERDLERTFRLLFRRGAMSAEEFAALPGDAPERNFELLERLQEDFDCDDLPGSDLLTEEELAVWIHAYRHSGFRGPVNWYRNFDRNWERLRSIPHRIGVPCLYVGASDDHVLPPSSADGMEDFVEDLERITIENCGHWTQQERPDQVNEALIEWTRRKFT